MKRLNTYEQALIAVRNELVEMSGLVGKRFTLAMRSFLEQDDQIAAQVIAGDDEIDLQEENLEMESLEIISLQQPMDRDLRFLAAAMRISRDLERIGDYACDIAELTLNLKDKAPYFKPLIDLPQMADLVCDMLHKSVKAYIEKDLATARKMDDLDNQVDQLFVKLLAELTDYMKKGPEFVDQASNLLLAARYLERTGDHVVNIAEMTIFAETGERHPFKIKKR
ncbi:MAG: phosphate signaling complex protein PhoU [Firmicutes bacterium]|nr:phosphate signaling complex protein PhoU [Bacillota bacterium]